MASAIEIFVGEATGVEARVYAEYRAPAGEDSAEGGRCVTLSGRLVGPECTYAHTLPAEFAFRDLGPGQTVLAEAVVPDPCCWTPALPHLYKVEVEARQADLVTAQYRGLFGIRRLSIRGNSLVLDGQRWVIRGVRRSAVAEVDLAEWREQQLAMLVSDPDDAWCEHASRAGVLLMAELPERGAADALQRLARWPAVAIAVVSGSVDESRPKNLLLAEWFGIGEAIESADWADAVVCEVADADDAAERLTGCDRPVIAVRSGGPYDSVTQIRAACDRLQRDLAPRLDVAGYIV